MQTWRDLTTEERGTQTEIRNDTVFSFSIREMLKHSLWKPSAAIRHTAITPLPERWNLIRLERLHKRIFILISLVKATQDSPVDRPLSLPASLIYLRFLAFYDPLLFEAGGKGHLSGEVFAARVHWAQAAPGFRGLRHPVGLHVILKMHGSPTAVKAYCAVKLRKTCICQRNVHDLDLLHVQYLHLVISLLKNSIERKKNKKTNCTWKWGSVEFCLNDLKLNSKTMWDDIFFKLLWM